MVKVRTGLLELADEVQRLVPTRPELVAGVLEHLREVEVGAGVRCISWAATSANCCSVTR